MGHIHQLQSFPQTAAFFVGIDSDGCVFDTMEIKHKECFTPNIINSWDLQGISRFVRDAATFVNLYSRWRGVNRFPGLVMVFDLLGDWPEVTARGYEAPQVDSLRAWIDAEPRLGNPALEAKIAETSDPVLQRTLEWSYAVNETVARFVRNIPPFPFVRECLGKLAGAADMIVCSATPIEALTREWGEHGITDAVGMICGQEMGKKAEHLKHAAGGKYEPGHMLMVGDAPGDLRAAKANDALFYPINPGAEAASWERLYNEGIDKFLAGQYAGVYEQAVIDEFMAYLPADPPWKKEAS